MTININVDTRNINDCTGKLIVSCSWFAYSTHALIDWAFLNQAQNCEPNAFVHQPKCGNRAAHVWMFWFCSKLRPSFMVRVSGRCALKSICCCWQTAILKMGVFASVRLAFVAGAVMVGCCAHIEIGLGIIIIGHAATPSWLQTI